VRKINSARSTEFYQQVRKCASIISLSNGAKTKEVPAKSRQGNIAPSESSSEHSFGEELRGEICASLQLPYETYTQIVIDNMPCDLGASITACRLFEVPKPGELLLTMEDKRITYERVSNDPVPV
jgi:hypothetical protein